MCMGSHSRSARAYDWRMQNPLETCSVYVNKLPKRFKSPVPAMKDLPGSGQLQIVDVCMIRFA